MFSVSKLQVVLHNYPKLVVVVGANQCRKVANSAKRGQKVPNDAIAVLTILFSVLLKRMRVEGHHPFFAYYLCPFKKCPNVFGLMAPK